MTNDIASAFEEAGNSSKQTSLADAFNSGQPIIQKAFEEVEPKQPGFFSRAGNYAKEAILGVPEATLALGTGAIASGVGVVAGNVTAAYEGLKGNQNWGKRAEDVSNTTKDILTYRPSTESGKALTEAIAPGLSLPFEGAKKVISIGAKVATTPFLGEYPTKEKYPNLDYTVESGAEAGALGLTPRATSKAMSFAKGEITPKQALNSITNIKNAIEYGVKKGIAPGVERMKNLTQTKKYFADTETAVTDIISNKDSIRISDPKTGELLPAGELPKTHYQTLEAITQGKDAAFKGYNDMKNAAGESVQIPLQGAANELRSFANAPGMAENPRMRTIRQQALEYADNLDKKGSYNGNEAQDVLQGANSRLKAFHRNPSFEDATPAVMENIVASYLRKGLGDAIEREQGPGYTEFRKKYGAYKTIEQDIAHRATVSQRQKTYGFFDYGNILTGMEAAKAVMNLSPQAAASAGVIYGIKSYMKKQNQPDYHIAKMFKIVDKEMGKGYYAPNQNPNLPTLGQEDTPLPNTPLRMESNYQPNPRQPLSGIDIPSGLEMDRQRVFNLGDVQQRPPGMVMTAEGRFRSSVGGSPMRGQFEPSIKGTPGSKEQAVFFKGTIPTTTYAPGSRGLPPNTKTYWVNEAARLRAAEEARRRFGK